MQVLEKIFRILIFRTKHGAGLYSLPIPKKISGRGSRVIPTQPAAAHGAVALYDQFATAPPPFRYAYERGEATRDPMADDPRAAVGSSSRSSDQRVVA